MWGALAAVLQHCSKIVSCMQASDMPDATIISVLHAPWTSWASLVTCDSQPHEAEAYQQVAKLSFPELALYRQVSTFVAQVVLMALWQARWPCTQSVHGYASYCTSQHVFGKAASSAYQSSALPAQSAPLVACKAALGDPPCGAVCVRLLSANEGLRSLPLL